MFVSFPVSVPRQCSVRKPHLVHSWGWVEHLRGEWNRCFTLPKHSTDRRSHEDSTVRSRCDSVSFWHRYVSWGHHKRPIFQVLHGVCTRYVTHFFMGMIFNWACSSRLDCTPPSENSLCSSQGRKGIWYFLLSSLLSSRSPHIQCRWNCPVSFDLCHSSNWSQWVKGFLR